MVLLGATAAGFDVLGPACHSAGRHVGTQRRRRARCRPQSPPQDGRSLAPRSRPDWSASYVYQRWQTTPYVAVRDRTSLFRAVTTEGGLIPVAQREQQFDAGAYRAMRRVRWTQTLTGAYHAERVSTAAPHWISG